MAFVICKDNTGYAVSLERHKVYKTVRDASCHPPWLVARD